MHSYRDLSLAEKLTRVPQNLIMRITEEILDIKHFILASIDYIVMHLKNIDSSSIRKFEMPADQEIKYGLRKYLIVATQLNTIIAIDTKYHSILWKYFFAYSESISNQTMKLWNSFSSKDSMMRRLPFLWLTINEKVKPILNRSLRKVRSFYLLHTNRMRLLSYTSSTNIAS